MSTTVDILRFYWHLYNQLLKVKYETLIYIVPLDMKGCICHFTKWQIHPFISKETICWALHFTNNTHFQSLEVVDRGSETQLKVAENLH